MQAKAGPQESVARTIVWPARVNHVPKDVFVRADVFEEELRRIYYGNEWLLIAHEAEIPNKGDFKTTRVGRVPLLITRDGEGEVHVFFNACSHRGVQLETAASGNKRNFGCPYHRWSFGCDAGSSAVPTGQANIQPTSPARTIRFSGPGWRSSMGSSWSLSVRTPRRSTTTSTGCTI
ncbi:MAG: Rieske (2Fe-2S) protein [Gammaproteobacteria bacterium]